MTDYNNYFIIYTNNDNNYELRDSEGNLLNTTSNIKSLTEQCDLLRLTNDKYLDYKKSIKRVHYPYEEVEINQIDQIDINENQTENTFDITTRFKFMTNIVDLILTKTCNGSIICGPPGVGKTHMVSQQLKKHNLIESVDYVFIKGYTTGYGLYKSLYENRNRLIIYDDCDAALFDKNAKNCLKAALDMSDNRIVSWKSNINKSDEIPSDFEFKGQVIFVSNVDKSTIDGSIISRTYCIDLQFTNDEVYQLIEKVAPKMRVGLSPYQLQCVLKYMKTNKNNMNELSLRTFKKIAQFIIRFNDWENMANYTLLKSK